MSNAVLTLGQGWFWVDFPTCIPLDLITHIITTGGAIPPDMRRTLPTSRPLAEYKPTERAPPSLISPAAPPRAAWRCQHKGLTPEPWPADAKNNFDFVKVLRVLRVARLLRGLRRAPPPH